MAGFDDRNILRQFFQSYEAEFAGSWAGQLGLYNGASDRAVEEYGILGANPAMREWIGPRLAQVLNQDTYEIRNKTYEATMVVPQVDLDRDKTGMLAARINTFAADAGAGHWESLLTALINANGTCYDGQAFFSATHSWGASGTQKNLVTVTEIPAANVGTDTAPTPSEAADVILQMTAYMLTWVNDKGRSINGQARNFMVQVATAPLFSAVQRAITANLLTGVVDNPLTGMKAGGFNYSVNLVPGLTSSTAVIRLYRMDGQLKPFILQDEQGMNVELLGRGSDFYFDNKAIKVGVDARRGVGYGAWEHALHCTLS